MPSLFRKLSVMFEIFLNEEQNTVREKCYWSGIRFYFNNISLALKKIFLQKTKHLSGELPLLWAIIRNVLAKKLGPTVCPYHPTKSKILFASASSAVLKNSLFVTYVLSVKSFKLNERQSGVAHSLIFTAVGALLAFQINIRKSSRDLASFQIMSTMIFKKCYK